MKTNWIKGFAFLLVLVMLVGTLSACGGNKNPTETPTGTTEGTEAEVGGTEDLYDSNGYLKDSLPETYDFEDAKFTIYNWSNQKHWEWVDASEEAGTGSTTQVQSVTEALVKRQNRVQDRFGVRLKFIFEPGDYDNRTKFISNIAKNIQTEQKLYDLVGQYTQSAGIGAMQGLYTNLAELPYLDLQKPWWPSMIAESSAIGDKVFFTTGDITPLLIRNIHCMFVNTSMYDSLSLYELEAAGNRTIYDIVRDGDWTLATMKELAIGTVGQVEGTYGLTFENNVQADAFFYGAGFNMLQNTDGIVMLSSKLTDGTLDNVFTEVKKLFTDVYSDVAITGINPFKNGKSIFYGGSIAASQQFSSKEAEGLHFSILPMPKLNKDQTKYYTVASFWVTMFSVPVDAQSKEMSGMILEGLGSESYRSLTDVIYENTFKMKYNTDGQRDSAEMFDIVSDSVVFDTCRFFADQLTGMFAAFRMGVSDKVNADGTWSTVYASYKDTWPTLIENMYEKVK